MAPEVPGPEEGEGSGSVAEQPVDERQTVFTIHELHGHRWPDEDVRIAVMHKGSEEHKIYDLSRFHHPGGNSVINRPGGRDTLERFNKKHGDDCRDYSRRIRDLGTVDPESITSGRLRGFPTEKKEKVPRKKMEVMEVEGGERGETGVGVDGEADQNVPPKNMAKKRLKRKSPLKVKPSKVVKKALPKKKVKPKPKPKAEVAAPVVDSGSSASEPEPESEPAPIPAKRSKKLPASKKKKPAASKSSAVKNSRVTKSKPNAKPKVHKDLEHLSDEKQEKLLETITKHKKSVLEVARKPVAKQGGEKGVKVVCGKWIESKERKCTREFLPGVEGWEHCWQHMGDD